MRDAKYVGRGRNAKSKILRGGAFGVLRDLKVQVFDGLRNLGRLPVDVQKFLRQPRLLRIAKSNRRATVHRRVHMDTIAVKKFDYRGNVTGEHLIIGLFTSAAYSQNPREIPLLRRKVAEVIRLAGFDQRSHIGKALQHVVETFPRDELLQIDAEDMLEIDRGVIHLQDRQRIALFARRDAFERFISAFVYVPRDRYTTALRLTFEKLICKAFNGSVVAHHAHLTDDTLGRLHLIIGTTPGTIPDYDLDKLETQLVEVARSWSARLSEALIDERGEEYGNAMLYRYGNAFPTAYREHFSVQDAVFDIQRMGQLKALSSAFDIVRISAATKHPVVDTGNTYFGIGEYLKFNWLRHHANGLVPENHWHALTIHMILDDLWGLQGGLTTSVVAKNGRRSDPINAWASKNQESSGRILQLLAELEAASQIDLAMSKVANREMRTVLGDGQQNW
jgi:NAD-specific glutamate dehydrogenase